MEIKLSLIEVNFLAKHIIKEMRLLFFEPLLKFANYKLKKIEVYEFDKTKKIISCYRIYFSYDA